MQAFANFLMNALGGLRCAIGAVVGAFVFMINALGGIKGATGWLIQVIGGKLVTDKMDQLSLAQKNKKKDKLSLAQKYAKEVPDSTAHENEKKCHLSLAQKNKKDPVNIAKAINKKGQLRFDQENERMEMDQLSRLDEKYKKMCHNRDTTWNRDLNVEYNKETLEAHVKNAYAVLGHVEGRRIVSVYLLVLLEDYRKLVDDAEKMIFDSSTEYTRNEAVARASGKDIPEMSKKIQEDQVSNKIRELIDQLRNIENSVQYSLRLENSSMKRFQGNINCVCNHDSIGF